MRIRENWAGIAASTASAGFEATQVWPRYPNQLGLPLMWQGLYINLDSRPDRRAHIEHELARFGLAARYRRVPGIANGQPYLGCYQSHLRALEEASNVPAPVHIIEDDTILSTALDPFLLSDECAALLEIYDILFLDMWVDPKKTVVNHIAAALGSGQRTLTLGSGPIRIGAMSSYIVAPRSMNKVRGHLLSRQRSVTPIDTVCDQLAAAGQVLAAVTIPFLTGVDLTLGSVSDIQKELTREEQRRLLGLRTRFFIERGRQTFV